MSVMNTKNLLLDKYLSRQNLSEALVLTDNLSFHWADWDQTCILQRSKFKNFNNVQSLTQLNRSLQELRNQVIWLSNKTQVLKSTLYDLYESYLDSRLRLTWFDRKDEILFSYESEHGPYYTITSMKWMTKEIYSQFIYRKILTEHYMLRGFRLKTSIPMMLKLDKDFVDHSNKVSIHQVSKHGVILKIVDKNFMNKINFSRQMHFKIPVNSLLSLATKNLDDTLTAFKSIDWESRDEYVKYTLDTRIMNFYGNGKNFRHSPDNEFYIFARYEDFVPEDHRTELRPAFFHVVEKVNRRFEEEVKILQEIELNQTENKKTA